MNENLMSLTRLLATDDEFNQAFSSAATEEEKYSLSKSKFDELTREDFSEFMKQLREAQKKSFAELSPDEMVQISGGAGNLVTKLAATAMFVTALGATGLINNKNASADRKPEKVQDTTQGSEMNKKYLKQFTRQFKNSDGATRTTIIKELEKIITEKKTDNIYDINTIMKKFNETLDEENNKIAEYNNKIEKNNELNTEENALDKEVKTIEEFNGNMDSTFEIMRIDPNFNENFKTVFINDPETKDQTSASKIQMEFRNNQKKIRIKPENNTHTYSRSTKNRHDTMLKKKKCRQVKKNTQLRKANKKLDEFYKDPDAVKIMLRKQVYAREQGDLKQQIEIKVESQNGLSEGCYGAALKYLTCTLENLNEWNESEKENAFLTLTDQTSQIMKDYMTQDLINKTLFEYKKMGNRILETANENALKNLREELDGLLANNVQYIEKSCLMNIFGNGEKNTGNTKSYYIGHLMKAEDVYGNQVEYDDITDFGVLKLKDTPEPIALLPATWTPLELIAISQHAVSLEKGKDPKERTGKITIPLASKIAKELKITMENNRVNGFEVTLKKAN